MVSVADFEAARPQLTAVAFRLLGSIPDAEDAVQTTWLRADAADSSEVRNSPAWLTTVVTRVCLDHLRARGRRREEPLLSDMIPAEAVAADEQYLQRENVSRALMVLLDRLTPTQRVAYVLHDLFGVPFREIADTLDTTAANAKKHASRARQRVGQPGPNVPGPNVPGPNVSDVPADSAVVNAFLMAAAGGDINQMIALMTDDCTRTVDPALVPPGTATTVTGAQAIAEETTLFADRILASTPMLVNGLPAHVIAPGGHLLAIIDIQTRNGRIDHITITRAPESSLFAMDSSPTN
ncbi:sigma-70 family RNA polymerase sigma factor [Rhodococcus spongiicola]|uniref:Sigma-70 family RNA polymerase sigma factor n=1 Tax=Rhodococcus spongiicola TaxID=2487352 RepID=A0A3S3A4C2_9NOCA|nr:sigma-70 family RNA polymerase sigma factor [Rhodococcus spongiicola]RVW01755.1 sigma-70 family RNA polymerase sigma factor [Rhodococcus spongiicola]